MSRNKMLVLGLIVLVATQFACGGTGEGATPEVAPNTNASDSESAPAPTPTTSEVPEKLADVAVMQGNAVVHKTEGYIMSTLNIPQSVLDARAACFSALATEAENPPCTALQTAEYGRMPASCANNGGEATKDGICSR